MLWFSFFVFEVKITYILWLSNQLIMLYIASFLNQVYVHFRTILLVQLLCP